jgi:PAS domain S-box-containing protein/putative nucleotidyltransferase with HDIG domain
LAAIVTSSPDAILTKDLHEVITSWNPAAEALFGYRAEEAIGAGMEVLLPPGLKAEPKRLTKRLLKGEKVEQFETQRKRKDGSLVYVALTLYPIRDERGHIAAISVVAHDITKRKQTEEVLWESEERYRSILDASPDGIVITDLKGRVLMASPAGLTMLGYDREDELLGRPLTDFIALEDRGRGVSNLAAMLRGDRAGPDEYRGLRADGSTFAGEVTGGSILGADGQPASLVFVVRDISQRRQAEEERLRAEGFFRDTFEHADVGIAHVNSTDGTWLRVNQRMCDLLGYTREELLRTTFAAITHPDDVEENVRHLRGMLAGEEETYRADKRYLRKDGSIVWVHLNVALIRQEDGTPDYNITVMTDITERMQAEEALAASERFRGHLLDTTPSLIYIYDLVENRNLYTNREITEFLGYTSEEILALGPALFLNLLHPDDAVLVAEHHERLRKLPPGDDSVLEIDYRMKRSDGEWRWLHSRDVPFLRDGSGVVTRILGSTDDVTEPKVSAELAARQAQRIEQTLTSVVDVTSDIVELRDPYTAGHQRRVTELAVKIAESLGLSGHEIDDIRVAGLLHDMGKAAVPTEILSKPGQLSPVEFELVKGHGEAGYRLAVSAHMAEPVAQMIHQHHERCDGSGYPQGLTGDQTLLGAKVLAVADVVEAMTSYRPYRSALGIEAALAEIERGSGRLYDARVAEACVRLFNEDGFEFSKQ